MAGYLLDTNSVIYFFNGESKISNLIEKAEEDIVISFITKIEMLSFEVDDTAIKRKIGEFLKEIKIILIDEDIIKATIEYRRKFKLKVPDAIICATAKSLGLTLVTADKILIKNLKGLNIISPI
jgi:predicted nucleic acid-binding protein